jgi:uncharacterized repeat protein (TIGR01451 family)
MTKVHLSLGFAALVASQAFWVSTADASAAALQSRALVASSQAALPEDVRGTTAAFFNSALTTSSPTYDNPGGSSAGSGIHYYCAQQFTVDTTGSYVIESTSPNTTGTPSSALDTFLALYANTFNPAAPAGAQATNDDFTGTLTVLPGPYAGTVSGTTTGFSGAQPGSRIPAASLTAGTTYILVNSSFRQTDFVGTGTNGQSTGPFYTGIAGPGSVTLVGNDCVTGGGGDPEIAVAPAALIFTAPEEGSDVEDLSISNVGAGSLDWVIETAAAPAGTNYRSGAGQASETATYSNAGDRASGASASGPQAPRNVPSSLRGGPIVGDWNEAFDDITTLPGSGWVQTNNSAPLGLTGWSQGADTVFPAHEGAPTAYISANFNNGASVATISNWLMTPEIALANGTEFSFWTREATGNTFPDRLQVRLSTNGASTNVGADANSVGDFTNLLLEINPTQIVGPYPQVWTEYTLTVSGLPGPTSGRVAFRYFVTGGGPSGANSNYIGIDTVAVTQPAVGPVGCDDPTTIPWLTASPDVGSTAGGATSISAITANATGVAPGTYEALLCVTSNDTAGNELVEVPVSFTVTPAGDDVVITVDPTSLAATQPQNTTTNQTLSIDNAGTQTGNWSIVEAAAGGSAPLGGPVVLFDNGPLITNPGAGAGGADASAIQPPNTLFGAGHQVSANNRVAEDFTVTDPGGWTIDSMTFYAYQSFSTTTSTINAINLQIWDGPPGAVGSNVVFGDTTTNRLATTGWNNVYRVTSTTLTNTDRPIFESVATVGTTLPPGTYWVDWQTGGTLASGPWAPPVSLVGQTAPAGANATQSIAGAAFTPLLDAGSGTQQALAFQVTGTVGGGGGGACDPVDAPWLSVSPLVGTTPAGGSTDVTVTFDSTGLATGVYEATVCVLSDDSVGNEEIEVPVSFTVTPAVGGDPEIEVAPTALAFEIGDGGTETQELSIENVGTGTLVWDIETDDLPAGGGYIPALDEPLAIPNFSVVSPANGGTPVEFTVPAGVLTSGAVVGFSFQGTVAGITGSGTWGSDMCMTLESPDGLVYTVGGISATNPACTLNDWAFQGSGSNTDGTYASQHLDAFTFPPGALDAGDWTITFIHDWNSTSAVQMDWSNVTVTLHKQSVEEACENPNTLAWLDVDPTNGSTAAGATSLVDVTANAAGVAPGSYEAFLCVNSNDTAGNELVVVPVSLTVGSPEITVDPTSIEAQVDPGDSATETLTIGNTGGGVLEWEINEAPAGTVNPRAHFPLLPRQVDPSFNVGSFLAEPLDQALIAKLALGDAGERADPAHRSSVRGGGVVPAYTTTGFSRTDYVTLDATVPGVLTPIVDPAPGTIFAQTFIGNDFTQAFFIATTGGTLPQNAYGYIDTATGVATQLGVLTGVGATGTWTSAKWDPTTGTVYAVQVPAAGTNNLYTIDVNTGVGTLVAPIAAGPTAIVIAIAIGQDGLMYGNDIGADALIAIDKTDGAVAVIGPTGLAANFAQDMDFDQSTGILYWPAYLGGGNSQMTTIDLTTGAASVIGPIQDGAELLSFAVAVAGGNCSEPADVPWLSVDQASGTILPGGAPDEVTVTLDSTGLAEGIYEASLCVTSNDADTALVEVPVVFTVGAGDTADLALSLFGVPSTVNAGGDLSLVATVANFGPAPATDVSVEIDLPAEFTFVSGSLIEGSGDWTCSAAAQLVTCELTAGTLPVGAFAAVLQVEVTVDAGATGGDVVTEGLVIGSGTDPNTANNTASVTTTIVAGPVDVIFANGFECAPGLPDCAGGGTPGVYTTRATFLENVSAGFYEEDFASVPGGPGGPSLSFSGNGFAYTITAVGAGTNNLFNDPGVISTDSAVDAIVVTFTGAPVTAVGGNFWATDISVLPTGTDITITLSNGTVETFTSTGPSDFRGFVTAAPITSITIDAPDVPANAWSTMDNLIVGD